MCQTEDLMNFLWVFRRTVYIDLNIYSHLAFLAVMLLYRHIFFKPESLPFSTEMHDLLPDASVSSEVVFSMN